MNQSSADKFPDTPQLMDLILLSTSQYFHALRPVRPYPDFRWSSSHYAGLALNADPRCKETD
jgi:hypothetical protein